MAQQINLYDAKLLRQRDWLALGNVVAGGVLLVAVVGMLGILARQEVPALTAQAASSNAQVQALRDQLTVLAKQAAGRKPDPRLEQELGATRLLLEARGEVLSVLQQRLGPNAESISVLLRGFANQTVAGLWLTGLTLDIASGGIEIQGRTVDPALLPEYIRRLNNEKAFQGRAFASLKFAEGKPEQTPGATPQPVQLPDTNKKAPFHEFRLTPVKVEGGLRSKPGALTQAPPEQGKG